MDMRQSGAVIKHRRIRNPFMRLINTLARRGFFILRIISLHPRFFLRSGKHTPIIHQLTIKCQLGKYERMMVLAEYAYVRVSTAEQREDRQLDAISAFEIPKDNIFVDKLSGKDFERPAYKSLLRRLRAGDLLYIQSIDRLGRDYTQILENWRHITDDKKADITVLDMPLLDTRVGKDLVGTLLSDIVLSLLSYVAQNERENTRKRQAEGIAAAKARGVHLGRPIIQLPDNFAVLVAMWEGGEINFKEVLEETGLKQATFYNRLREHRRNKE